MMMDGLESLMMFRLVIALGIAVAYGAGFAALATAAPPAPASPVPPSITLFEKPNFQGRSMTFTRQVASLNAVGFNDTAQSVKIEGAHDWVLCESRNFLGRCVRVRLKEKDLKRLQFSKLASSIYLVREPNTAKKP